LTYELALVLLAIFGPPAAVIELLFLYRRRTRRLEKELGLYETPPSEPGMDDILFEEGEITLSRRTDRP
jgi:hypothetical protein